MYISIMYLFRVRNDLRRILIIEKRIQLVETIRLSTHIDNFEEEKNQKFYFEGAQKKLFFNL